MILVGIDDTDVAGSRGTNQLARRIVRELSARWRCVQIVRHQLLDDPRVPCTTKNGSASIALEWRIPPPASADDATSTPTSGSVGASPARGICFGSAAFGREDADSLLQCCRRVMRDWFVAGSDPGLCLLWGDCPPEVIRWGQRCQREFVSRDDAFAVASSVGVHLEALGGTKDGVIGALAAVGLAATRNDGRIVQLGDWPDDLSGRQTVGVLNRRGVRVREYGTGREFAYGTVDVGKHLRPNVRQGEPVLFVEPAGPAGHELPQGYRAVRLP